jgi:putative membrane protein
MIIRKVLIGITLNSVALFATVQILDEVAIVGGIRTYIYAGIILGLLNSVVKPLFKTLTSPWHYLSLGISLIVLNTFIFVLGDMSLEHFYGLKHDIIIERSLVSYAKVGKLFGVINWIEHLIVK